MGARSCYIKCSVRRSSVSSARVHDYVSRADTVCSQAFVDMLNRMRFGEMDAGTIKAFRNLSREVKYDDGISPTEL